MSLISLSLFLQLCCVGSKRCRSPALADPAPALATNCTIHALSHHRSHVAAQTPPAGDCNGAPSRQASTWQQLRGSAACCAWGQAGAAIRVPRDGAYPGAARPPSFDPAPGATCAQFQPVHDQGQERDHGRHCCFSTLGRAESNTNRPVSDAVPEQEVRQTHEAVMCVHAVVGRPKGSMQQHQVCRQQGRARPALVWHPGAQLAGSTQQAHAYAALATWREQRTAAAMLIQAAVRGHLCR
eukprot:1145613-Pelagomonas_calceolata.AAC.1